MEVEVTPSVLGKFVPQFLLKFKGDVEIQNYFRRVLKGNYHKGVVNLEFGHCQVCCSLLTFRDKPRMKSSSAMTKKVHNLLTRSSDRPLGKYHRNLVQKFLKSSTQLIVKCPSCGFVNTRPLITNEAKLGIKDRLLKSSVPVPEPAPSVSKKKKKKKRKKKQEHDNSGLIIPTPNKEQTVPTQRDILSPVEDSVCSPLVPEAFSTPLSADRGYSTPVFTAARKDFQNLGSSVLGKTPKAASAQIYSHKTFSATPAQGRLSHAAQGRLTTSHQQKRTTESSAKQRKMKRKQLKEFLSQDLAVQKPASLSDFLSSL